MQAGASLRRANACECVSRCTCADENKRLRSGDRAVCGHDQPRPRPRSVRVTCCIARQFCNTARQFCNTACRRSGLRSRRLTATALPPTEHANNQTNKQTTLAKKQTNEPSLRANPPGLTSPAEQLRGRRLQTPCEPHRLVRGCGERGAGQGRAGMSVGRVGSVCLFAIGRLLLRMVISYDRPIIRHVCSCVRLACLGKPTLRSDCLARLARMEAVGPIVERRIDGAVKGLSRSAGKWSHRKRPLPVPESGARSFPEGGRWSLEHSEWVDGRVGEWVGE